MGFGVLILNERQRRTKKYLDRVAAVLKEYIEVNEQVLVDSIFENIIENIDD